MTPHTAHRLALRHPAAIFLGLLLAAGCAPESDPVELRAVWLTNVDSDVLGSRDSIARAMAFLADHHFNTVFPVVWNKGFTLYRSAVMDSLFGIPVDTAYGDRDPLREVVDEAHARGLAVIPWFEFGFSSSYSAGGGHILRQRPAWAARDTAGGLLAKNGFEWMNAYHPEVQEFLLALVTEVARTYAVDGVQGDDRLPAQPVEGGYSAMTRALYAREHEGREPPGDPRDPAWIDWRAGTLTRFAGELYRRVKAIDTALVVSWAPGIYPWSREEYLQDWPSWVRAGAADMVIPQVYRYDLGAYRSALRSQSPDSLGLRPWRDRLFAGILISVGEYRIAGEELVAAVRFNREQGFHGESLFFYEGLRRDGGRLAALLRSTVYARRARPPFPLRSRERGERYSTSSTLARTDSIRSRSSS